MTKTYKPLPGHAFHRKTDDQLRFIIRDAALAATAMKGHDARAEAKYLDQVHDAGTILRYRADLDARLRSTAAVDAAIASSNRAGRRISGREARAIHALLKGRH